MPTLQCPLKMKKIPFGSTPLSIMGIPNLNFRNSKFCANGTRFGVLIPSNNAHYYRNTNSLLKSF